MTIFHRAFQELNPVQLAVLQAVALEKLVALMLPRQVGKTHLGVWIIREVLRQNTNAQTIFLAKDFPSVVRASKDKFLKLFPEEEFRVSVMNGISFHNPTQKSERGSCFLGGVEKAVDKFRGGTMALIHWSEAAFSKFEGGHTFEEATQRIFLPMLSATNGMFLIESTPNGSNFWKKFWEEDEIFTKILFPVELCIALGAMTREQHDFLERTLHPDVYRQEVLCEFVTFTGKIYKEYASAHNQSITPEPHEFVNIGIDIGYSGSNSSILFGVTRNGRGFIFDQIYLVGYRHDEIAGLIDDRMKHYGMPKTQYAVFTDVDKDLMDELRKRGIQATWADKLDTFACRMAIKVAFHEDKLFVDPLRCTKLINELNAAAWSEKIADEMEMSGDPNSGHWDSEASLRYWFRGAMLELEKPEVAPDVVAQDVNAMNEWSLRKQNREVARKKPQGPIEFEY